MFRRTLLTLVFLAATPALAGTREDVYAASQRCSAIKDDRSWLNCYYGAAQPMRGQLQLPAAPTSQTSLIPPAPSEGTFAKAIGYLAGGPSIESHVKVKSYEAGRQGNFTIALMNGQVWEQTDEQQRLVKWNNGPEAHEVTIWKGALDTFNLGFDDETDRYKVRRLK